MTETKRRFFLLRHRPKPGEAERNGLLESLEHTRALIAQAYAGFNSAQDMDLIESYVFEINALQSRYSYLLRRVKALDQGGSASREAAISQRA